MALHFNTLLFILIPLSACAAGYFARSKAIGALSGLSLFLGYTIATSIMEWGTNNINVFTPLQYILAFVAGGFGIVLLGTWGSTLRNSLKNLRTKFVTGFLVVMILACGYAALPHYGYYYQISIRCSEDIENLEIWLPLGATGGTIYEELLEHRFHISGGTTESYTLELLETEHGTMLRITIPELKWEQAPDLNYTANIILWQKSSPHKLTQLKPKYNSNQIDLVTAERFFGPVKTLERKQIESFDVPIKAGVLAPAEIEIILWNRTDIYSAINFAYFKDTTYTETLKFEGTIDNDWLLVPVQATTRLEIRGVSG